MANINWFPGHMNRTKRLISEQMNRIDIILEVIDARIPESSRNPLLHEITSGKPHIIILNKTDLADAESSEDWYRCLKESYTDIVRVSTTQPASYNSIVPLCRKIVDSTRTGGNRTKINAMIAGIPNVGKSTLVNRLKKQKKASVQNKPGHTKDFQRIVLSNDFTLIDTPGLLWHKFEPEIGYKLAILGSIKDAILDIYDIAFRAADIMAELYPEELKSRFKLESIPEKTELLIEEIGRNRGFLLKGGVVDTERACKILLSEIRDGKICPLTLDVPGAGSEQSVSD